MSTIQLDNMMLEYKILNVLKNLKSTNFCNSFKQSIYIYRKYLQLSCGYNLARSVLVLPQK